MLWLVLVLSGALFEAIGTLLRKMCLVHLDEYLVAFSISLFASVLTLPSLFFLKIPEFEASFLVVILCYVGINLMATIAHLKAIKISPISLSVPFLSFAPVFLLVLSPLTLNEYPSLLGLLGVLVIVLGTFMLSIKDVKQGFLAPFKVLSKEKGTVLMVIVAFLFSVGSIVMKIGVRYSDPLFFVMITHWITSVLLFPLVYVRSKGVVSKLNINLKFLFPMGLLRVLTDVFIFIALGLAIASYVSAVKRSSIILSVLFGYVFFKEQRIVERLIGAAIMVMGILLISFA